MGKLYSNDLRERVVAFIESGHSRRASARHFGVSDSFSIKLMRRRQRSGSISADRQGRPPGSGKLDRYRSFLIDLVEARPDITMPELSARLEAAHGVVVRASSLSRFLIRQGYTYKKSPDGIGTRTRCRQDGA